MSRAKPPKRREPKQNPRRRYRRSNETASAGCETSTSPEYGYRGGREGSILIVKEPDRAQIGSAPHDASDPPADRAPGRRATPDRTSRRRRTDDARPDPRPSPPLQEERHGLWFATLRPPVRGAPRRRDRRLRLGSSRRRRPGSDGQAAAGELRARGPADPLGHLLRLPRPRRQAAQGEPPAGHPRGRLRPS